MRVGLASAALVWMECPYCGSDCVSGEDGSQAILWKCAGKLTCDDCGKECKRPKKVTA
jgi:hypothetical protein